MRTIRFRMWDGQEMLYKLADQWVFWEDGNTLTPIQDNLILMQSTGLKDKNGKDIFESDIVRVNYVPEHYEISKKEKWVAIVEWDTCNPTFVLKRHPERFGSDVEYDFVKCGMMKLEVIGNIHENPELLEVK